MWLDPDEYLPEVTMRWCQIALEDVGISGSISFSQTQPGIPDTPTHCIAYLYLRQVISHHLSSGNAPALLLSSKPSGALRWQLPEAPDVELDIDQDIHDVVPEYLPVVEMIEAGGED